jgi:hypothetical protein
VNFLKTNESERSKLSLRAEAKVLCALRSANERYGCWYVDFGELPYDAGPRTESVVLERGDGGALDVRVLGIAPRWESTPPPPPDNVGIHVRMLERGQRYAVDITLRPPWTQEWPSGRVRIATGVPEQPEDEIDFSAHVLPRLSFEREPVSVPQVLTGPFKMKLGPHWSEDRPPGHILAIETPVSGMQACLQEEAGMTFVLLEISPQCPPPSEPPYYLVTVHTDDPDAPRVRIPIQFNAVDNPPRAAAKPAGAIRPGDADRP